MHKPGHFDYKLAILATPARYIWIGLMTLWLSLAIALVVRLLRLFLASSWRSWLVRRRYVCSELPLGTFH
jgi:hypothetical protein